MTATFAATHSRSDCVLITCQRDRFPDIQLIDISKANLNSDQRAEILRICEEFGLRLSDSLRTQLRIDQSSILQIMASENTTCLDSLHNPANIFVMDDHPDTCSAAAKAGVVGIAASLEGLKLLLSIIKNNSKVS